MILECGGTATKKLDSPIWVAAFIYHDMPTEVFTEVFVGAEFNATNIRDYYDKMVPGGVKVLDVSLVWSVTVPYGAGWEEE